MNVCPSCGGTFKANAGHCRGEPYHGCCKSFATQAGFDEHKTGHPSRCLTTQEMTVTGWQQDDGGFWISAKGLVAREKARTYWEGRRAAAEVIRG